MVYVILRKPISPILTIKNFPILLMTPHPNSVYCVCEHVLSHALFYVTPYTAARQAPLSMGFSRQEYWSGLPFPSLGDLPDPGIEPRSPTLAVKFFTTEPLEKQTHTKYVNIYIHI